MSKKLRIGTRGSKLALWQANHVKEVLRQAFPNMETEIIVIKTKGDKILDVSLSKIGDKGLFTKEIEKALLDNEIDMAVHSLKDLPTELPADLSLGAILEREDPRDAFVSKDGRKLSEMTANDKIGTSSLRRRAQLLAYNPELNIVDIRGNVDTRLQRMEDGHCDAVVLAGAGLIRLGYEDRITELLDKDVMLPAVSQGAVGIEVREADEQIVPIMDAITHWSTWEACMVERWVLRTLEGGCQVPVACHAEVDADSCKIKALVSSLDGVEVIAEEGCFKLDDASEYAIKLANSILNRGGKSILDKIREQA